MAGKSEGISKRGISSQYARERHPSHGALERKGDIDVSFPISSKSSPLIEMQLVTAVQPSREPPPQERDSHVVFSRDTVGVPTIATKAPQLGETTLINLFESSSLSQKDQRETIEQAASSLIDSYVIKRDEIPESYFKAVAKKQREEGKGTIRVPKDERCRISDILIADQQHSLKAWITYLTSDEATYPAWFKSWTLRSVLTMDGKYDKKGKKFGRRSRGTVAQFPIINREILGKMLDVMNIKDGEEYQTLQSQITTRSKQIKRLQHPQEGKIEELRQDIAALKTELDKQVDRTGSRYQEIQGQLIAKGRERTALIQQTIDNNAEEVAALREEIVSLRLHQGNLFPTLINESEEGKEAFFVALEGDNTNSQGDNFAKLYAWYIERTAMIRKELLEITTGEWIRFPKGSDPSTLVNAIKDYATGWCIAGVDTAAVSLGKEDIVIYFSHDEKLDTVVPRVAIGERDGEITQVGGIEQNQALDIHIAPVVEQWLDGHKNGGVYKQKIADMKRLTAIQAKISTRKKLDAADLTFLYEVDRPIQSFGLFDDPDPRIERILRRRNAEKDMLTIFGCEQSEVAHTAEEITETTKAFVGPLTPGILGNLRKYGIKQVYTEFPNGKVMFETLTIGGKSQATLEDEMKRKGIEVYSYRRRDEEIFSYTTLEEPIQINVVRMKTSAFNLESNWFRGRKLEEIWERAEELGLAYCPAEAAMHYGLGYQDQSQDYRNQLHVVMAPELSDVLVATEVYQSMVLKLSNINGKPKVIEDKIYSDKNFSPGNEFLFLLPSEEIAKTDILQ